MLRALPAVKPGTSLLSVLALATYSMIFIRDIGSGALRYFADVYSVGWLWFVPDLLAAFFVVVVLGRRMLYAQFGYQLLFLPGFLGAYALIGYYISESWLSVGSGLKMILPVFFGYYAGVDADKLTRNKNLHALFFVFSAGGIILSQGIDFPWIGHSYFIADGKERLSANQRWIAEEGEDVFRYSGFATDSTAAGETVMLAAMVLMLRMKGFWRTGVFLLAAYAIIVTVSRTVFVSLLVFYITLFFVDQNKTSLLRTYFVSTVIVAISAPTMLPLALGRKLAEDDLPLWLYSMAERIRDSWVTPWELVYEKFPWALFTGLGLGPVGAPVQMSDVSLGGLEVIDNFLFANFLMFGVGGLLLGYKLFRDAATRLPDSYLVLSGALVLFGVTIQGFGAGIYCVLFGLALGAPAERNAQGSEG